jgi:hypothetical protein
MIEERRIGFLMDEVMTGVHEFEPGCGPLGKRDMEFRVSWGAKDLKVWANPLCERFFYNDLKGVISIDGLCEQASCVGGLDLRYFRDRTIRYDFTFSTSDGKLYRYVGEKVNIWPWNLLWSHTTCFGRLTEHDSGRLVSTSITHFRFRTLPAFISSLRFA